MQGANAWSYNRGITHMSCPHLPEEGALPASWPSLSLLLPSPPLPVPLLVPLPLLTLL